MAGWRVIQTQEGAESAAAAQSTRAREREAVARVMASPVSFDYSMRTPSTAPTRSRTWLDRYRNVAS